MNTKIQFCSAVCCMILYLFTACVHEHPGLTADGEVGVDPTEVMVTADIVLDIQLTEIAQSRASERNALYKHRFIIDAYLQRDLAKRMVVYADLTEHNRLNIPVTMKLHARDYQLVVWADYVLIDEEKDLYYDTEDLSSVIGTTPYTGNTEYKDIQTASLPLELNEYRRQWGAKVPVRVNLQRPTAHYKLIATDVQRYLNKTPGAAGKKYTATIKYDNYLPVGYNTYDGFPKHSYMYMQYSNVFTMPTAGTPEVALSFDYLFASDKQPSQQVTLEIKDEKGVVIARTIGLTINYVKGKSVVIRGPFLHAKDEPGVGINPDFEGEKNIETEVTFL